MGTPITLGLMMLVAHDRRVMGAEHVGAKLAIAGRVVTGVVTVACAAFLWQTFF